MDEKKEFTEGRYMDIIFGIILYAEMFLLGFCMTSLSFVVLRIESFYIIFVII